MLLRVWSSVDIMPLAWVTRLEQLVNSVDEPLEVVTNGQYRTKPSLLATKESVTTRPKGRTPKWVETPVPS